MKTIISMLLLVLALGLNQNADAQNSNKNKETTALYLSCKMDCHSCENTLTEHLKFEKGVKDLKCDFPSNTIYLLYKANSNSTENIIKSIAKKGYEAQVITKEDYDARLIKGGAVEHKD